MTGAGACLASNENHSYLIESTTAKGYSTVSGWVTGNRRIYFNIARRENTKITRTLRMCE